MLAVKVDALEIGSKDKELPIPLTAQHNRLIPTNPRLRRLHFMCTNDRPQKV